MLRKINEVSCSVVFFVLYTSLSLIINYMTIQINAYSKRIRTSGDSTFIRLNSIEHIICKLEKK
jgi:hypothetical protein